MSTTLTPPPNAPATPPPPGPSGEPPRMSRPAARVVAILTIVLGTLVLAGAALAAVFSTVFAAAVHTDSRTADAAGITELDVDVSAGSFELVFDDVDEAVLEVTSGAGADRWGLERDAGTLVVDSPRALFGGWLFGGSGHAVLTLPAALERTTLDATYSLSAGDLDAQGRYGDLSVEMGAGAMRIEGSAREVDADVSAGRADLLLSGVSRADLAVSAGQLVGVLRGDAPDAVGIDVSAGSLELTLPDAAYDVRAEVSAGELDNRLETAAASPRVIEATVSAGQVILRSAD
ncbi:hypothetical protein ACIGCK_01230 [Microbacterium sp. NPDC078428]|uniref:hypothetical protein n=1 Tax=Microbacterium sp. NPDC078428 TaxID=3364190 RepID=UPI0037CC69B6